MKINEKRNCSKVVASYLFLGTLAIFTGLGADLCLAAAVDVSNIEELEKAIGNDSSTVINITTDYIKLNKNLPVIGRSLIISGATGGSTLDVNNARIILEFNTKSDNATINIAINNICFQNSSAARNDGSALYIRRGTTITLNNTDFSNNTAVSHGGAILTLGDENVANNTLTFSGKTTFTGNKSTEGDGG
ncbi:MAG: hypothetical protein LBP39_03260, partial [Rickettsiales bacterium]|nr:hypothetical protein [Rickettsiales bacterium]